MIERWRIAADAAPALRVWAGDAVVHHAMSNDTHRLSAPAARILIDLIAAGSFGIEDPGRSSELPPEEIQAVLEALEQLDFIARC